MPMKRKEAESAAESWMANRNLCKPEPVRPIPVVGVEIVVRVLLRGRDDFSSIEEVMDKAREYGSAEIKEYKVFSE